MDDLSTSLDGMHVVFLLCYISSHSYVTHHLHIFFYLTNRVHLPKNNEIMPILTKQNLQICLNLKINIAIFQDRYPVVNSQRGANVQDGCQSFVSKTWVTWCLVRCFFNSKCNFLSNCQFSSRLEVFKW